MIKPKGASKAPAKTDVRVVGVFADLLVEALAAVGADVGFVQRSGFAAKPHQTLLLDSTPDILLVGLGESNAFDLTRLRGAAGSAGRTIVKHAAVTVELTDCAGADLDRALAAAAVAEGWLLGAYSFDTHKSTPNVSKLKSITILDEVKPTAAALQLGAARAKAICWVRDVVNEPGGSLPPAEFAERIKALASESNLKATVWSLAQIRKLGLGGVLGVSQGATNEPRFVKLEFVPTKPKAHIALVGKGVTFDTGGYSLKPAESMKGMNSDMAGAGALIGAMSLLSTLAAQVRVTGFFPLVENMIGPDAIRVGDVLTIRGGKTVEVLNTDAEGRLILADALRLACEAKPDAIIDAATLTGAIIAALGPRTAGVFGSESLQDRIIEAASATGEAMWPMPMLDDLRPGLDSQVADLQNISGGRFGGASIAALFLREFVDEGIDWAHLDIAGPAWITSSPVGEVSHGGTGFGVRAVAEMLSNW